MMQRLDDSMSNLTSEASISSSNNNMNEMGNSSSHVHQLQSFGSPSNNQTQQQPANSKKRRNLPGNPDPEAEVVALSPRSLMATNRFLCEICNKGFQRDQNLQLHRRGHNLPWKLKQRSKLEVIKKKVYVCPEASCVHHDPSRALGDLTGIKKHFSRKHGEKKWKCEKCSKRYAVQSDWKAHSKICGTREYRCDCGTLFSRRDSFITHRAFCDALAEETSKSNPFLPPSQTPLNQAQIHGGFLNIPPQVLKQENSQITFNLPPWLSSDQQSGPSINPLFTIQDQNPNPNPNPNPSTISSLMSATALLQKAAQMGVTMSTTMPSRLSVESGLMRPNNQMGAPGFCATSSSTSTAGLPSRDQDMGLHGLASFGNKFVNVTSGCMELQDNVILPPSTSFDGFDDSFDGMFNTKRSTFQENSHLMSVRKDATGGAGAGGGDGMTRDFLGLRAFPDRDFLNMAGFDEIGSSSYDNHHTKNQAPW